MAPTTEPRAVIVGTGRSGSGYISEVLNAAGIRCGHESWWNPVGHEISGLDVDSSWCAVRDLQHRQPRPTVYMQTRDPLKVIASLAENPDFGEYRELRESMLCRLSDDPLLSAIQITYGWTKLCLSLQPACAWRVESLDDPHMMKHILANVIGPRLSARVLNIDAALEVPLDVNDHKTRLTLDWDDIPLSWRGDLQKLSTQLGYS